MAGVNKSHCCELSVCLFGEGASFIGRQRYKKISFDVGYLNVIFGIEIFPDGPITRLNKSIPWYYTVYNHLGTYFRRKHQIKVEKANLGTRLFVRFGF